MERGGGVSPLVVIGICTYNNCESLLRTIESVQKLDYDNYKVIVVDNNSTDNTKQYINNLEGVEYVFEKKQGIANARNKLIDSCIDKAEYLGMVDDDETVNPDWIKQMLKCFLLDEKIVAVGSRYVPVYEKPLSKWLSDSFFAVNLSWKGSSICNNMALPGGNIVIKGDFLKKTGFRYNEKLSYSGVLALSGEDVQFSEFVYKSGYKCAFTEFAYVKHYISSRKANFKWITQRYFFEGVTQYYRYGTREWICEVLKLPLRIIRVFLELCTFDAYKINRRFYKFIANLGTVLGPIICKRKKE